MKNGRFIVLFIAMFTMSLSAQFAGGDGSPGNPYQVSNADGLYCVRFEPYANYIQIADIDLGVPPWNESPGWEPIGLSFNPFLGSYNGNGFKIQNLYIAAPAYDYIGLFGYADGAVIDNIILSNSDVNGGSYCGILAGYIASNTTVTNCSSSGNITGSSYTGGLIGYNDGCSISECYSVANVDGYISVGGLVAENGSASVVTNSFARGSVSAFDMAGGFNGYSIMSDITNCYSTGSVSIEPMNMSSGGFIGFHDMSNITESFWDTETSGLYHSYGAIGKTTAEMKDPLTFTNWDLITPVWSMDSLNSGYPYLAWSVPEEPVNPFAGGCGTDVDPYLVAEAYQLDNVRNHLDAYFLQIADIDLGVAPWNEGEGWLPIGTDTTPFKGSYDGGNYTISNMFIDRTDIYNTYTGLFGFIDGQYSGSAVENVILDSVDINDEQFVGALAGYVRYANIIKCSSSGSVTGEDRVGGLIGLTDNYSVISRSYSNCIVTGIPGSFMGDTVGGLTGELKGESSIEDSFAGGKVSGNEGIGGLVGFASFYSNLSRCYSFAWVAGSIVTTGGLTGWSDPVNESYSYYDKDTSGQDTTFAGTGKTFSEMHDQTTYETWDFTTVWQIDPLLNYGYPYLAWSTPPVNNTAFAGGKGTSDEPYWVSNPVQLDSVRNHLTSHFRQVSDIDIQEYLLPGNPGYNNGEFWDPIGYSVGFFDGIYDGNFKTITNLRINKLGMNIGLFSETGTGSEIRNLNIFNPDSISVTGGNSTGSIAGVNRGTITKCVSNSNVESWDTAGCLVGYNSGTISFSYAAGHVMTIGDEYSGMGFGGLTGANSGTISNCYSRGKVTGNDYVGGLVGSNSGGLIEFCYSSGKVTGTSNTGGLAGYAEVALESFWDIDSSYQLGTYEEGGRNHAEMLTQSNYDYIWDFTTPVWVMDTEKNSGYPYLAWSDPVEPMISFAGGTGTSEDPYQIADADQLNEVRNHLDAYFIQTADIDLSPGIWSGGEGWLPIGNSEYPFTGNYNGQYYTISGLRVNRPAYYDSVGLFGHVDGGDILFVDLANAEINAGYYTAILAGSAINFSQIIQCSATGDVTGQNYIGGLIGYLHSGTVSDSYARGTVSGNDYLGGFAGSVYSSTLTNCYSTTQVIGTGGSYIGGFAGYSSGSNAASSYWNTESSGYMTSALGVGKTTAEMRRQATYSGWEFCVIWDIYPTNNSGYPYFLWKNLEKPPLFAGGDGTESNPYQITNVYELQNMNVYLNADYIIMNDINASETEIWNDSLGFEPVGFASLTFTGTLNGQNYMIDSLFINRPESDTVGLFGRLAEGSELKNINITASYITGHTFVGALAGSVNNSKISSCTTSGEITGAETTGGFAGSIAMGSVVVNCESHGIVSGVENLGSYGGFAGFIGGESISYCNSSAEVHGFEDVGGFVGFNMSDSLFFCSSSGNVYGQYSTGGFCGSSFGYSIKRCFSTGNVNGNNTSGGFIGEVDMSDISDCFSRGSVTGSSYTGGFAGITQQGSTQNCYSTGLVTGSFRTGGLIGYLPSGEITSCYWDTESSGILTSDGGEGKMTAEMKTQATFVGWNFSTTWDLVITVNEGYPYLIVPVGTPQNVLLIKNVDDIVLTWKAVPEATSYKIFSSQYPYGDFTDITGDGTFLNEISWIYYINNPDKMFCRVVAVREEPKKKTGFMLKNK